MTETPTTGFAVPADAAALVEEALDLWACGIAVWGDYVARMAGAITPAAWLDANTRLVTNGLEVCTRATALRLRHAGLAQPLLNDA
ncbi:MAG: hypothetical protein ACOY5Y_01935 [Pseudomonadota bacterium]|jgi:hypothetical protein